MFLKKIFKTKVKRNVISDFKFAGYLRIKVESQGFIDKKFGRTLYGRSRAYIRVNGRDYSLHRRGFNVIVINRRTGKDVQSKKHMLF